MKKILSVLAISSIVLAACGTKAPVEEGLPKIGATIYRYDDNFMSFVRQQIETAAKDKAELTIVDSQNDQTKQGEQVDQMIAKGVKSLAINLVDPQAAATIIAKAKAAGIPVVFFNKEPNQTDLSSYDKTWYVGTNSAESGIMQGQIITDSWKANPAWDKNGDGKIQYVLLKGEPGHPDAEARTAEAIKAMESIGAEQLELQTAMWDSTKATELMDAWLAKHGDKIEYVVANNDGMAEGAVNSLTAAGYFAGDKFMPVVGIDAIPSTLALIEQGKIVGTVLNDAVNQGQATFDLALNAAQGKQPTEGTNWVLGNDKCVRVAYVPVTKDNLAEFK